MLTCRSLLKKTADAKKWFFLLSRKFKDILNTVVRQITFCTFEQRIHTARR